MADLYDVAGTGIEEGSGKQGFVVLNAQMWQERPAGQEEKKARNPSGVVALTSVAQ